MYWMVKYDSDRKTLIYSASDTKKMLIDKAAGLYIGARIKARMCFKDEYGVIIHCKRKET